MASMPPPPPPPPSGGTSGDDRQTGTVKMRAMEAWSLWERIKHALRQAWLALLARL